MAIKLFVDGNSTATVSDNNVTVIGATTGTQTVKIATGVTGVSVDANVDSFVLPGALSTYKFVSIAGTGTQVVDGSGNIIETIPSLNQTTPVTFADGTANLVQTGASSFTLGGQTIASGTSATNAVAVTAASLGSNFTSTQTVALTTSASSVNEGSSVTYTVTLGSPAPTGGLTIPYTLGGTAPNVSTNYTVSPTGSFTIAAGQTTGSVTLNAVADVTTEGAQTVALTLGTLPTGYTLASGAVNNQAVTINDTSTTVAGQTFVLTTAADNIAGTAGNDTITGVIQNNATPTDTGTLNSSDAISGNGGVDTLTARVTSLGAAATVVPVLTNISTVLMTNVDTSGNTATINLASATGVSTVGFQGTVASSKSTIINAPTTASISIDAAKSGTLENVNLGSNSGRTGTADAFTLTVANGTGTSSTPAALNLVTSDGTTADTSFEIANITASGASNYLTLGTGLAGLTAINVSGTTSNTTGYGLTLNEAANFASMKTISAANLTGGLNVSTTGAALTSFTGSASNDRLAITGGNANLTSSQVLNFGAGSNTLALGTDTAIASYAAAKNNIINALTTVQNLEFTAAAVTTMQANLFTNIHSFKFSGGTSTATTLALTGVETADSFTVTSANFAPAAAAAQTAGTTGTVGVDAITFTGASVAQTANLLVDGGRSITGATGQAHTTNTGTFNGGAGGSAISFGGSITKLVINSTGTSANTISGGTGGAETGGNGVGGAGGAAIANSTSVQSVDITGSTALTIAGGSGSGAGVAGAGFSGAVNVNATAFTGKLTLTGSTGADSISVGSGGSVIRGFGGADTITLGSGVDQVDLKTAVADSNTAASAISLVNFTAGQDKIVVTTLPTLIKQGAAYTAVGTGTIATDLATAIAAGGALSAQNAAVVTITGTGAGTYLVYDANGSGGYVDAGADLVVKLVGLSGTLSTGDFATAAV